MAFGDKKSYNVWMVKQFLAFAVIFIIVFVAGMVFRPILLGAMGF